MAGILYIVATPIGNLEDITLRAINTLKEVDLIAAEDTRHTLKLLNHFNISKPLTSYFEHNKASKGIHIINEILSGKNVALVSDAGSPGISDPGEDLIKEAIQNNIKVTSVPGPSAAINALIISGLSTSRFAFEGFLPKNSAKRKEILKKLQYESRTLVFYESPHELLNTLKDFMEILGNRKISLAREMTKKFENVDRITMREAVEKYTDQEPKGEFVIVVEGNNSMDNTIDWCEISVVDHINYYINNGVDSKEAIKKVAKDRGISKRDVYKINIEKK